MAFSRAAVGWLRDDGRVLDPADRWYVPIDGNAQRFIGVDGLPTLHLITYAAGETVLRLCEAATGLLVGPTDRRLPACGIYVSNLRGARYHEASCRAGDFAPRAPLRLVREPDNPHDRLAIAVYDSTGRHLGAYVNKQRARQLSKLIDGGADLVAIALRGTAAGIDCHAISMLAGPPVVVAKLLRTRPPELPAPAHLR